MELNYGLTRNKRTRKEGDKAATPVATPVPELGWRLLSAGTRRGRTGGRQAGPGCASNLPRTRFHPHRAQQGHCDVTSEPQDVTPTLSPHRDQNARQEASLDPIPVRVSKQNQPNHNLRSTAKENYHHVSVSSSTVMANVSTHHTSHMATLSMLSAKDIRYQS